MSYSQQQDKVKLTFYGKSALILKPIPRRYRESILNILINEFLTSGLLKKNLSFFLTEDEIAKIYDFYQENGLLPIEERRTKIKTIKTKKIKKTLEEKEKTNDDFISDEELSSVFIGFDD